MKTYKELTDDLIANTRFSVDDVFDIEGIPLSNEFNEAFNFYYTALQESKTYGIGKSYIFFKNNRAVNAAAGKDGENYIAYINSGTIITLREMFAHRDDLLVGTDNDEYLEFERSLDSPIHILMYQNALHFTFYHELAHLVQKSKFLTNYMNEIPDSHADYIIRRHLLELDADKYSALCLGAHVLKFLENNFGKEMTSVQLEKTLVFICSSILFYILSFSTNEVRIYYKENSHPHPVIRATSVIMHIIEYILGSLKKKGYTIDISKNGILNNCFLFSERINRLKFGDNRIEEYQRILATEIIHIAEYLREINELESKDTSLACFKWNQLVLKINTGKKNTCKKKIKKKRKKVKKKTNRQIAERWMKRKRSKRTRIMRR